MTIPDAVRQTFGSSHALIAVIHYQSALEARTSIDTALDNGAHGVVLINQGVGVQGLRVLFEETRGRHPQAKVGLNVLGNLYLAFKWKPDFVWLDNGREVQRQASARDPSIPLFGGVAFKTQSPVADELLYREGAYAESYLDVPTTSGPGTGLAAPIEKLVRLRHGMRPETPLGLASGVTPENVDLYLPLANAFIVGTGIERGFGVLDPASVRATADKVRAYAVL